MSSDFFQLSLQHLAVHITFTWRALYYSFSCDHFSAFAFLLLNLSFIFFPPSHIFFSALFSSHRLTSSHSRLYPSPAHFSLPSPPFASFLFPFVSLCVRLQLPEGHGSPAHSRPGSIRSVASSEGGAAALRAPGSAESSPRRTPQRPSTAGSRSPATSSPSRCVEEHRQTPDAGSSEPSAEDSPEKLKVKVHELFTLGK
ncbi:hypothetical protein EYF80_017592 [Liparis tanakae]|uniref:Uncharacterized protein n=1 Tax=Liparis tanakae TaxID=230148 RepID=A0A4Z2I4D0_9TELE|nr:hypothetical protein EYF80_017592 [Liparis tanakae]